MLNKTRLLKAGVSIRVTGSTSICIEPNAAKVQSTKTTNGCDRDVLFFCCLWHALSMAVRNFYFITKQIESLNAYNYST